MIKLLIFICISFVTLVHSETSLIHRIDSILTSEILNRIFEPRECGRRQITQAAFIINGWEVRQGEFPWHAALYHKSSRSSKYKCGGSLIDTKTVITAAHCLFSKGRPIVPGKVSIQLGKHHLNVFDENTKEYQALRIIIHPEYNTTSLEHDIALIILDGDVKLTKYISHVCLWPYDQSNLDKVSEDKGTVVGWGLTQEEELSEVLNASTLPIVSILDCLLSNRDFFGPFLSEFNYCAGYRNGTSVCNGDSGGGMVMKKEGLWHLRGLVSFGSVKEGREKDICNPKHYVIFTDVAKYLDWIYIFI